MTSTTHPASPDRADAALTALKAGVSGLCACTIHESGRGLSPCIGHATRLREQEAVATGCEIPGEHAQRVLDQVHYWHEDHSLPTLSELRPTRNEFNPGGDRDIDGVWRDR